MRTILDWPVFLCRLGRDELFDKFGYYPIRAGDYPPKYLSRHGLALACDAHGGVPYVMYHRRDLLDVESFRNIRDGDLVWLKFDDLELFNRDVLPRIDARFVVLSGICTWSVPSENAAAAHRLVDSGKVIHWYATHCDRSAHPELISGIPLGLNYAIKTDFLLGNGQDKIGSIRVDMKSPREQEAEWDSIVAAAPPLAERSMKVFADFHLNDTSTDRRFGESRGDIHAALRGNPNLAFLSRRVSQPDLLRAYARHAFVLSPHGHGLDCYRTWEALLAGCIVIVKRSPIDYLYDGLPVVILEDWREIDAANLNRWRDRFGDQFDRGPVRTALSTERWMRTFNRHRAAP